jgi:hypothetical protein
MLEDPIYQSLDKRRDISVVRQFPLTRLPGTIEHLAWGRTVTIEGRVPVGLAND